MAESISERINSIASNKDGSELKFLIDTVLADNTRLATAVDTLSTALNTLATKLNADATVTDENYAADNATDNAASIELEE